MAPADLKAATTSGSFAAKPSDDELDYYGATDRGKVRPDNQDHFLIATIHQQVVVHGTSLADVDSLPLRGRIGSMGLVADGVGGAAAGDEAARIADTVPSHATSNGMSGTMYVSNHRDG